MEQSSQESYFTRLREVNFGLTSAIEKKDRAKQLFVSAAQIIKEFNSAQKVANNYAENNFQLPRNNHRPNPNPNNNFFEMEVSIIVQTLQRYFAKYQDQLDMQKGLVYLSNLVLYYSPSQANAMVPCLPYIAQFFTAINCEEANYQTLALLAQILELTKNCLNQVSTGVKEEESNEEDSQETVNAGRLAAKKSQKYEGIFTFMNSKEFVYKIMQIDLEEIENEKRQKETVKMLGVILTYFCKNLGKIREFRVQNQLKLFLLKNIRFVSTMSINTQKLCGNLLYCLCQLTSAVKFNDKEILKNRTIEILMNFIDVKQSQLLLFGALKVLKVFWRAQIRKAAMIKQGLVQKLLTVYKIQPRLILSFIEEVFADGQQILLAEFPQFFNVLLETVYQGSNNRQEDLKNLIVLLQRMLGNTKASHELLQTLEHGLINFLTKQFGYQSQQDAKVAYALNMLMSSLAPKQPLLSIPKEVLYMQMVRQQQKAQQEQQVKQEPMEEEIGQQQYSVQ